MEKKIWYAPNKKEAYGDKEIQAVVDCLNDGWLAGFGPRTIDFEEKVSQEFGKKYGLFVNSGSSAILLGLKALDLKPNDEIITPACTFSTTIAPIIQCGLTPIFCDVEIGTYVPTVEKICEKITEKTKVILLPNLIGSKPDWNKIRSAVPSHIILFEDSADTITNTVETDIAITSFYSSHLITAAGSGGMLMVNDDKLLKKATMYRDWGRQADINKSENKKHESLPQDYNPRFIYEKIGYNFQILELQAAMGRVQLKKIQQIKKSRKKNFDYLIKGLSK